MKVANCSLNTLTQIIPLHFLKEIEALELLFILKPLQSGTIQFRHIMSNHNSNLSKGLQHNSSHIIKAINNGKAKGEIHGVRIINETKSLNRVQNLLGNLIWLWYVVILHSA
jgi:hypothetical protein